MLHLCTARLSYFFVHSFGHSAEFFYSEYVGNEKFFFFTTHYATRNFVYLWIIRSGRSRGDTKAGHFKSAISLFFPWVEKKKRARSRSVNFLADKAAAAQDSARAYLACIKYVAWNHRRRRCTSKLTMFRGVWNLYCLTHVWIWVLIRVRL